MTKQENRRYYSMAVNQAAKSADIDIYGDITSYTWKDNDISAWNLSQRLAELEDVDTINVNINSYGGEVAEGLAIYNALRRHNAKVVTRVDGFACSIASVIAMAGDERIMSDASLLMIHNAWCFAGGNAADLRKQADDLDTITEASKAAYMSRVSISVDELAQLMDSESWITPEDAFEMGFITAIEDYAVENVSQSAARQAFAKISAILAKKDDEDGCKCEKDQEDVDEPCEPDKPCEPDDDPDEPDDLPDEPDDDPDDPYDPEDDPEDEPKASAKATLAAYLRTRA